jgi:hypothetical protein
MVLIVALIAGAVALALIGFLDLHQTGKSEGNIIDTRRLERRTRDARRDAEAHRTTSGGSTGL